VESRNCRRYLSGRRSASVHAVQGTFDAQGPSARDVSVEHGVAHVGMAQQFLHGADVVSRGQEVRGETMPEGMATCRLQDPHLPHGCFDGPLHDLFMLMVVSLASRLIQPRRMIASIDPFSSSCH
jgi:hypothetical protein